MASLAEEAGTSLKKFLSVNKTKKNEDDAYSVDSGMPTTPDDSDPAATPDTSDSSGTDQLESVISNALIDLGLVSCSIKTEDDGDIYADLSFESGETIALQFYVDGSAKVAMITADNQENPPETVLPDSLVGEDGSFNLSAVADIPAQDIKDLVSQAVTVSNKTETYRRFRGSNESVTLPGTKKRISIKFRNENARLRQVITKLKKA